MSSRPTPSPPLSTTTFPSPSSDQPPTISDEEKLAPPSPTKPKLPSGPPPSRTLDCWSEDATRTLIDAWGSQYLDLNRGNLRQNHWQAVADAVNDLHATTANLRRTDVQCKNRVDTVKKKYKIEKSKALESRGRYVSKWTHFSSLDSLLSGSFSKLVNNASANRPTRNPRRVFYSPESSTSPPPPAKSVARDRIYPPVSRILEKDVSVSLLPWPVPVGRRSKRSGVIPVTKRNFSVMAAAAVAMEAEEDEVDDDGDVGCWRDLLLSRMGRKRKLLVGEEEGGGGYWRLAEAVLRLGKMYEKVELAKQRQMVELEKQRMQFAKDLEIQRMKVFMESQIQLEKLKRRAKHNSEINSYL